MCRKLTPLALLATLALGGAAHADSFKTEPSARSKIADKVGPKTYAGEAITKREAWKVVARGVALMKKTQNVAIRMDAIREVDSATMDHAAARQSFARKLMAMSKKGGAVEKFTRGYSLLFRTGGKGALAMVQKAARDLPKDAAVQLGAFQATADYAYGANLGKRERNRMIKQAAGYYNAAAALSAKQNRPLVKENLKESHEYELLYPELAQLIK
jgi:hypothetical protein